MGLTGRLGRDEENALIETIRRLDSDIQELKVSSQYAEAKLFEYSSANPFDLSGSLPSSSGGNAVVMSLNVTATSVDGTSFISSFVPQLFIGGSSTPYYDTLNSAYQVTSNTAVSSTQGTVVYWFTLAARSSVAASSFQFKARLYSTAPVTVTYTRIT